VTWDSDISRVLGPSGRASSTLMVMRGAKVEEMQTPEGDEQ
jgi:hypothetical protein